MFFRGFFDWFFLIPSIAALVTLKLIFCIAVPLLQYEGKLNIEEIRQCPAVLVEKVQVVTPFTVVRPFNNGGYCLEAPDDGQLGGYQVSCQFVGGNSGLCFIWIFTLAGLE